MSFCENLKCLRKNAGLTQKEVSTEFEVALSTVAMWESGNRQPDLDTVGKLARFFHVSVDELIGNEGLDGERFLPDEALSDRITPKNRLMNEEVADIRELLRTRPEVKMLFSASKNASKEDIERAVAIIEALKEQSNG